MRITCTPAHYAHICNPGTGRLALRARVLHTHPVTWSLGHLRAWVLARPAPSRPAPVALRPHALRPHALHRSPSHWHTHPVTQHLSPAPGITASLRAFSSTITLPVVFNSTLARGNPAHLPRFATFPRYCVLSVIVQVFRCLDIEAPASPFCPPRPWGRP
ncbi:hypothetical protein [Thiolapillus sp.]|uniref:hypothetical protein n=1 Tax=Thiolapillus sp. TaxID=2017437 RepID=UPI003AF46D8A